MADFDKALRKVLRHEGVAFNLNGTPIPGHTGYVDHEDDPGGETNFGITKETAHTYGYDLPMGSIPYSTVLSIYRIRYWDKVSGNDIPDQEIAEELFDTAVNCGWAVATRFFQRTLNVLNVKGTKYPDLVVDGRIGPRTLRNLQAALAVRPWYRDAILRALDSLQCVRYIKLAERDEKFESFMPGWLRTRVGGY